MRFLLLAILIYGFLVWGGRNTVVASTAFLANAVSTVWILFYRYKYGKDKLMEMAHKAPPKIVFLVLTFLLSSAVLIICCLIWLVQAISV